MPEQDADAPEHIKNLVAGLDEILGLDIERDLVRAAQLGEASFEPWRPLFIEILDFAQEIRRLQWHKLTESQVATAQHAVDQLRANLSSVQSFNLQKQEYSQREIHAQNLKATFNGFKETTTPLIGYLSWASVDHNAMANEMRAAVDDVRRRADDALGELKARREEADRTLDAIRTAAATAGVSYHAEVFKARADEHERRARYYAYLGGAVAVVAVIAAILMVSLWRQTGEITDAEIVQFVALKTLILALLLFAFVNIVRIYRSESHLAVLDRHREDSLRTFRAFADATADADIKDKVLLEATHTIFSVPSTGMIDSRDGTDTIEVLDGVSSLLRRS